MTRFLLPLLLATSVLAQDIQLQPVVTGLSQPVSITHAGDDRIFITQQGGRVVIFNGTRVLPEPFLDLSSLTTATGERGLLSIAFHPRYRENGFFYVNYTDLAGDTVVARYSVSATNPNRADPGTAVRLLHIGQPFANHNGGQMHFGRDGYLYIGMGDGGSGGDPGNRAQNLSELLGKMLRIDVDRGAPYAIPDSNPFVHTPGARPEIWALGLRNPWRFSFDRAKGDLWIADVGQGQWEEINHQPGTSSGGENYGWRRMEGTHCFEPRTNCSDPALVLPVIEYDHRNGACSVTGGYVYRGRDFPRLDGAYIYGDYCSGVIWAATRNTIGGFTTTQLLDTNLLISTFGEDVDGELYVADHRGSIHRLIDTRPQSFPKRRSTRH
jgi:glucose/arabinose dehydrogenase